MYRDALVGCEALLAASDLSVKKRIALDGAAKSVKNGVIAINGGGDYFVIRVNFQFEGHLPHFIFKGLPPAIHIPASGEESRTHAGAESSGAYYSCADFADLPGDDKGEAELARVVDGSEVVEGDGSDACESGRSVVAGFAGGVFWNVAGGVCF